ncbi:hypothetical protein B879_02756 [Cecembia lonarensis LW9]|uniref:Addiction module component n=2 Tax=Cecembia TaxID=1187078 RepID=K1LDX5_CECL9|nr:hypothetical protein B879_02756 [Cecembia lonarensis LW9]
MQAIMDLSNRKLLFIQEFLKINSEKTIAHLEMVLKHEVETNPVDELTAFTIEELEARVKQSEKDFLDGKFKTTKELLRKYE